MMKNTANKKIVTGVVMTALALLLAGCGGGGGGSAATTGSAFNVQVNNSPLIGVTAKIECANGVVGQGVVGTSAVPGAGTIQMSGNCTAPIRVSVISAGKMRPIGANANGSEDVAYDPTVNLPLAAILASLPTDPAAIINVDPVTTLVANIALPATSGVSGANASAVATAQAQVAASLGGGLTASDLDKGYTRPELAAAAARIVEVAALAANQVGSGAVSAPATVGTAKSLGQFMAEKLADAARTGAIGNLASASGVANAMSTATGTNATVINVNAASGVTTSLTAIDADASFVAAMIGTARNNLLAAAKSFTAAGVLAEASGATSGVSVAGVSGVTATQMGDMKRAHTLQAAKDAVRNTAAKMVADVFVLTNGVSGVAVAEQSAKQAIALAAASKMIANMDARLNGIAAGTPTKTGDTLTTVADVAKVVATGVAETIKQDLNASAANKVFAAPPAVGAATAATVAAALVGDLEDNAPATFNAVTNGAVELKIASAVNAMGNAMSAVSATNPVAFNAAVAAVAAKLDTTKPVDLTKLQALLTTLTNSVATALGAAPTAGAPQAQNAAQTTLGTALGTATVIDFAAPPAPGTAPTVALPPVPPAPPAPPAPVVDAVTPALAQIATNKANAATAAQTAAQEKGNAATQTGIITGGATGTVATAAATAAQTAASNADIAAKTAQAEAALAANAARTVALAGSAAQIAQAQTDTAAAAASATAAAADAATAKASAATAVASVVIAPSAPTMGAVTAGNASVVVSFAAPANNGGSAITGYTVTASPGGLTATGTASPITVSGLTNGTAYTFTVVATNRAGNSVASTASASATPAAVPGVPTAVSAVAGNAQATVSFTAPANNGGVTITGYDVAVISAGITVKTVTSATSPVLVAGLTNGTAYTFKVTAKNAVGSSAASAATTSVTPMTVPGAATAVTASAGDTTATVSFTAPNNGGSAITGYSVAVISGGVTVKTVPATGSPVSITGLTNGTAYTFTVTASNVVGTGAASTATTAVTPSLTPAVPGAPTAVTATAGDTSATVSFTAPTVTGSAAITAYTVTSTPGNLTATGTASPISITGLTNGTAYTFTVKATNSVGSSVASTASASVTPAALICKVAVGSAVGYVSGASACSAAGVGGLNTNGGGATVTVSALPAGVTATAYSALLVCDPFGAPPAAGATSLVPCKN